MKRQSIAIVVFTIMILLQLHVLIACMKCKPPVDNLKDKYGSLTAHEWYSNREAHDIFHNGYSNEVYAIYTTPFLILIGGLYVGFPLLLLSVCANGGPLKRLCVSLASVAVTVEIITASLYSDTIQIVVAIVN